MDLNSRTGLALLVLTVSLVLLVLVMMAQDSPQQVMGMDFNSVQFQFTPASGDAPTRTHQIAAMQGDEHIGTLAWRPGNGSVDRLWVHPEHRRQGLALGMMRHVQNEHMPTMANGRQMRLQHSAHRDPDGERFAQATKGEFYAPPNLDAPRSRRAGRN